MQWAGFRAALAGVWSVSDAMQRRYYPGGWDLAYDRAGDLTVRLHELVRKLVPPGSRVLDFGAGGGTDASDDLRGTFQQVCGVDVDPAVLANPYVHEAKCIGADGAIPYPDDHFDAAYADWVLEHLPEPGVALREISRVLKPGGLLVFRTLNRWAPLCLISQCMPRGLSAWLAHYLGHEPAGAGPTFPTYWRLNSRGQLRRHGRAAGLELTGLRYFETHPLYYRRFTPLWLAGVAVERLFNRCDALAPCRVDLIGVYRKDERGAKQRDAV